MSRTSEERLLVDGPSGNLEIAVSEPDGVIMGCALIAHPHPLYGGTLDNKVVQTLAKAFNSLNLVAIRFNFRGVGHSDGVYDNGDGEVEDFKVVLNYVVSRFKPKYLIYAGFSFGTYVVSQVAITDAPDRLVLVAPAVGKFEVPDVLSDTVVVHGEKDDVVSMAEVLDWARPQKLPVIVFPAAGHFFHGDLVRLKQLVIDSCGYKLFT